MYHYTRCGLSNVYLKNGYEIKKTPYGEGVSIHDIDGLHKTIGMDIALKHAEMTGEQFRFLRVELEFSQARLGDLLGRDAQSVAIWEKKKEGKAPVPKAAANFLRILYLERVNGNVQVTSLIERINELDRELHEMNITLSDTDHGWTVEAA